jgi:coenzyme F420 biosynthesis associated uncharacterized protein
VRNPSRVATHPGGLASRTDPVAWDVALGVARQVVRLLGDPLGPSELRAFQRELEEVTSIAERLVERASGLSSKAGATRAMVVSREGWVEANVGSFARLLRPIGERLVEGRGRMAVTPASKIAAGAEIGLVLGWMSSRVLGQYDLFPEKSGEDAIYYVASNIASLERQHGFEPGQFRLWIALHEVTHRLQFTGVDWMRDHFLGIVERGSSLASPNLATLLASFRRAALALREGRNPLAEGGILGLIASDEQLATLRDAQALMSLLEGHSNVVMSRAAIEQVPDAARFSRVLHERRTSSTGIARLFQQLIGLEAKMLQYSEGERFVESVLEDGGDELFAKVWSAPSMLPSLEEVRDPSRWIARVGGSR